MGRITIKDIARESGYSIGTVSRALNNNAGVSPEAKAAIFHAVEKHNFRLNPNAKFLKQKAREGIAILIRGSGNLFFLDLVEKIQKQIEDRGYDALVYYFSEDDDEVEQAIEISRQRFFQGMLFLGSTREHFRRGFSEIRIPCLLVTNSAAGLPFSNLSSVTTDDAAAAQFAVEYFLSAGHTKIGVLGGNLADSQAAKSRYQGIQYAFFGRDLSFSAKDQYVSDYFTMDGGYRAMNTLLDQKPDLTAVFVMSDVMAIGAIRAISDRGLKVPDDISVIGFDGLEISRYYVPRLTTIRQDTAQIARRSVEILISTIENLTPPVFEEISFSFQEGNSVKRLQDSSSTDTFHPDSIR